MHRDIEQNQSQLDANRSLQAGSPSHVLNRMARAVRQRDKFHGKREAFVFRIPCAPIQIRITYFNYNHPKTNLTERAPQERRGNGILKG